MNEQLMNEQLSLIISILSALLTGGFLMLLIESQQVSNSVAERYHFAMSPFFHSFSNYVKFICSFKTFIGFNTKKTGYIERLRNNIDIIAKLGYKLIMSGQNYPTNYFTAEELDSKNKIINDIWYCFDKDYENLHRNITFDIRNAQRFSENTKRYLKEISPIYNEEELTKNTLAKVSGDFYCKIYQPIKSIPYQYEKWKKKEKQFKILTLATIALTLSTMIIALLVGSSIPIWIYKALCVLCSALLMLELYKLIKLENLSKKIMRF